MTGFEPATTRPPDAYSNRAELHPVFKTGAKVGIKGENSKNKGHFFRIRNSPYRSQEKQKYLPCSPAD